MKSEESVRILLLQALEDLGDACNCLDIESPALQFIELARVNIRSVLE